MLARLQQQQEKVFCHQNVCLFVFRVCATDPTCVLCINCFQKSQHRNHKYRVSVAVNVMIKIVVDS